MQCWWSPGWCDFDKIIFFTFSFSQNIYICLFPFLLFLFFLQLEFVGNSAGCTAGVALFNNLYNDLPTKSTQGLKEWRTDFLSQTFQATELECDIAPYRSYVQYSNYSEPFFNAIADGGGSATFSRVQRGEYSYLEADSADRCNSALPVINTLLAHLSNVFSTGGGGGDDDGGGEPVATPVMKCSSSRVSTEQSSRTCILVTVCPHPAVCIVSTASHLCQALAVHNGACCC